MDIVAAERALARRDPVLRDLIRAAGPCVLIGPPKRPHFEALARSITYQQLAGRAAEAIWKRVRALVPGAFTPASVLAVDMTALRAAAHIVDGTVHLSRAGRMADDDIVAELSQVWGIGTWTAQMFLMFQLGRLDVWPVLDLGVRAGYGKAWGLMDPPTPKELEPLGERFRPYRSVAAWYCWRALEI
jgi:DNA-3-methyladenine glycosylase II